MNPEYAAELLKTMIFQTVALASPFLMTAMVFGLAISLFQAVTTISEPTLAFVPKALGVIGLLVVLLPWMLRTVMEFTTAIIERIPQMAH